MTKRSKASKRNKPVIVWSIENAQQLDEAVKRDEALAIDLESIARNLARPDFRSGLQPDGSIIEF